MEQLFVWLYALDQQQIPDWVEPDLARENIRLESKECRTSNDLIACGQNFDVLWLFGGGDNAALTADVLERLPKCSAILRTGSGTDNVPVAKATELGVLVINTPEAVADSVAEHSIGLLFSVMRQIPLHDHLVRQGIWDRDRGWPRGHLDGQTVGIIGFGNISRSFVRKLRGFDINFLACDPKVPKEVFATHGVTAVDMDSLLRTSDYVFVHCNLNPTTRHLLSDAEFALMKPTAALINISRGPIVDEAALYRALNEGRIAAAGLDVLETEPASADHPLFTLPNVVITPHIGALSDQYLERSWQCSVNALVRISKGLRPKSLVNPNVSPRVTFASDPAESSV